MNAEPRLVEVRRKILKENDLLARTLRERFRVAGVHVISLVSSPGSGKTTLLERLLRTLSSKFRAAALVGDLATENDALRLARAGVPVKQINTNTVCHLDATMVQRALEDWNLDTMDFLFIENVGNLVCPASFDLGEDLRLVLTSTTEGEDKPLKYPMIFNTADVAVITKMDLAKATEFNIAEITSNILRVRPGMEIVPVSALTGEGMKSLLKLILSRGADVRAQVA
jgi:hydrogenase nickel incorporation protein HypB